MKECAQSLINGEKCAAPAVTGTLFCRHHDPQREIDEERRGKLREQGKFSLPDFHDKAGLLAAIRAVLDAMAERIIKRSEAQTFLCGLKFAAQIMKELDQEGGTSFQAHADVSDDPHTQSPVTPDQILHQISTGQVPFVHPRAGTKGFRRPSNRALARLAASLEAKSQQTQQL